MGKDALKDEVRLNIDEWADKLGVDRERIKTDESGEIIYTKSGKKPSLHRLPKDKTEKTEPEIEKTDLERDGKFIVETINYGRKFVGIDTPINPFISDSFVQGYSGVCLKYGYNPAAILPEITLTGAIIAILYDTYLHIKAKKQSEKQSEKQKDTVEQPEKETKTETSNGTLPVSTPKIDE